MAIPRTNAGYDANFEPTVLGVSTADGTTPVPAEVNPLTGAWQVESPVGTITTEQSLISYYASATGGRLAFNITTGIVIISGAAEQPLAVLENPAGSGKDIYLDMGEFGCSVNTVFRRYAAPTIATRGAGNVPRNLSGGATASVLRFYPAGQFTLSANGTVSKTAHIAAYQQYKTDIHGRTVLRPGSAVYWTIDQPTGGSSFTASIYFEFWELTAQ